MTECAYLASGAGLFLGFFIIVVGRIMDWIEMTRVRMGGNSRRPGGRGVLAGGAVFITSGAVLFVLHAQP